MIQKVCNRITHNIKTLTNIFQYSRDVLKRNTGNMGCNMPNLQPNRNVPALYKVIQLASHSYPAFPTSQSFGVLSLTLCTILYLVCVSGFKCYVLTLAFYCIGLVKTHFFHIWVQCQILRQNHELQVLHELLADVSTLLLHHIIINPLQFELPGHVGRLPKNIGEPGGGSLSADQWLTLALAVGPIVVSTIPLYTIYIISKLNIVLGTITLGKV